MVSSQMRRKVEIELEEIDRDREVGIGESRDKMKSPLLNKKEWAGVSTQGPLTWGEWEKMTTEVKWGEIELVKRDRVDSGASGGTLINQTTNKDAEHGTPSSNVDNIVAQEVVLKARPPPPPETRIGMGEQPVSSRGNQESTTEQEEVRSAATNPNQIGGEQTNGNQ